ncbi:MAG: hypothetical protein K0R93_3022, partial [Anaerosolibacter sp.]|nr:hypothetical protein [Anaerosolibacter sp.]
RARGKPYEGEPHVRFDEEVVEESFLKSTILLYIDKGCDCVA